MSVGNRERLRKRRERLWLNDPHCENCGKLTILPEQLPGYKPGIGLKGYEQPSNMATIQHRYSKNNPKRKFYIPGERRHLLWCHECNKKDNIEEQKK